MNNCDMLDIYHAYIVLCTNGERRFCIYIYLTVEMANYGMDFISTRAIFFPNTAKMY